jgi:hypothetical protein
VLLEPSGVAVETDDPVRSEQRQPRIAMLVDRDPRRQRRFLRQCELLRVPGGGVDLRELIAAELRHP